MAAVAQIPVPEARRRLRALAAHNLIEETARDVFVPHDLVWLYLRLSVQRPRGMIPRGLKWGMAVAMAIAIVGVAFSQVDVLSSDRLGDLGSRSRATSGSRARRQDLPPRTRPVSPDTAACRRRGPGRGDSGRSRSGILPTSGL